MNKHEVMGRTVASVVVCITAIVIAIVGKGDSDSACTIGLIVILGLCIIWRVNVRDIISRIMD